MASIRWLVVGAALGASAGCAIARAPLTGPEAGGPPWRDLATPHVLLHTDLPESEARSASADFERGWQAVERGAALTLGRELAPLGEPVEVLLFDRAIDLHALFPGRVAAFFHAADDLDQLRLIVMASDGASRMRAVFQHEATHRLLDGRLPRAPAWLNEGLAEYLSSARLDGDGLYLGAAPPDRSFRLYGVTFAVDEERRGVVHAESLPALADLLSASPRQLLVDSKGELHAASWLLVHLLATGPDTYHQRLHTYAASLAANRPAAAAWRESFGDLPMGRLDAEYRQHFRAGAGGWLARRSASSIPSARVAPLAAADVHLLWSRALDLLGEPGHEHAFAEADEALRLRPDSGDAHVRLRQLHAGSQSWAEARRHAEQAVALAPGVRTWSLLAYVLAFERTPIDAAGSARVAALCEQASSASPSAEQAARIAWLLAAVGRTASADALVTAAVARAPGCVECLYLAMSLKARRGETAAAIELGERGLALDGLPPRAGRVEAMLDGLRRIDQSNDGVLGAQPLPPQ